MPKKKTDLNALVRKTDIEGLVRWKPEPTDIARVDEVRQGFIGLEEDLTYSEVHGKYPTEIKVDDDDSVMALVRSRAEIVARHDVDSLEGLRRESGLDIHREELIEGIRKDISFDEGLKKLLVYINKYGTDRLGELGMSRARTLRDVAKVMPEISSAEIAWLSTLRSVPDVYLQQNRGVPTILDFNVEGIEFGFDGLDNFELERIASFDAYAAAGFTGVAEGVTFKPYEAKFAKAFKALALLTLSDSLVYTKLYDQQSANSLVKGEGNLKRKLIENNIEHYSFTAEELEKHKLRDLDLSSDEHSELEDRIRDTLANKQLFDLGRDAMCSTSDLVTTVGLLERVPEVLVGGDKFAGYVLPFGKGLKFLDQDGNEVEYVAYDPYLRLEAQQHIRHASVDISRNNQLVHWFFDAYAQDIEARISGDETLPIDRLRERFRVNYGTVVPTRAVKSITAIGNFMEVGNLKTSGLGIGYTLKIGTDELQVLLDVLDKLPRDLVPEITAVHRRRTMSDSLAMFIGGFEKLGSYSRDNRDIKLYSAEDKSYRQFSAVERQELEDTLLHETGHGIWPTLSESQRASWRRVSKADSRTLDDEIKGAFVYDIEQTREIYTSGGYREEDLPDEFRDKKPVDYLTVRVWMEEDFAEHFSAYVNHGVEFRERASKNRYLKRKYDFFKRLFGERAVDGETKEYDSKPGVTLEHIQGYKGHLMKKRSLDQALILQNKEMVSREQTSIGGREEVAPSYEAIGMTDEERETNEHIFGQRDPIDTYILNEVSNHLPDPVDVRQLDHSRLRKLLDRSVDEATRHLTRAFPDLDRDDTFEFLGNVKEGIESGRYKI